MQCPLMKYQVALDILIRAHFSAHLSVLQGTPQEKITQAHKRKNGLFLDLKQTIF